MSHQRRSRYPAAVDVHPAALGGRANANAPRLVGRQKPRRRPQDGRKHGDQTLDGSPPPPLGASGFIPRLHLQQVEGASQQVVEVFPNGGPPASGSDRSVEAVQYRSQPQGLGEGGLRLLWMGASDSSEPLRVSAGQDACPLGPPGQPLVLEKPLVRCSASLPVDGVDEIQARVAGHVPERRIRPPRRETPAGWHGRQYNIRDSGVSPNRWTPERKRGGEGKEESAGPDSGGLHNPPLRVIVVWKRLNCTPVRAVGQRLRARRRRLHHRAREVSLLPRIRRRERVGPELVEVVPSGTSTIRMPSGNRRSPDPRRIRS